MPDLFLPAAGADGTHGLFIELKAGHGRPTESQRAWRDALRAEGYAAVICNGWREAAHAICDHYGASNANTDPMWGEL